MPMLGVIRSVPTWTAGPQLPWQGSWARAWRWQIMLALCIKKSKSLDGKWRRGTENERISDVNAETSSIYNLSISIYLYINLTLSLYLSISQFLSIHPSIHPSIHLSWEPSNFFLWCTDLIKSDSALHKRQEFEGDQERDDSLPWNFQWIIHVFLDDLKKFIFNDCQKKLVWEAGWSEGAASEQGRIFVMSRSKRETRIVQAESRKKG
jgi:hypothetical protein